MRILHLRRLRAITPAEEVELAALIDKSLSHAGWKLTRPDLTHEERARWDELNVKFATYRPPPVPRTTPTHYHRDSSLPGRRFA